jgi:hypothetical protein
LRFVQEVYGRWIDSRRAWSESSIHNDMLGFGQRSESRIMRGCDPTSPRELFDGGSVTCTVTTTAWEIEPTVAVTVTVYVAGVVRTVVDTVRVDEAVPLAGSVRLLGLMDAVGQTTMMSEDEIDAFRFAVPERPLRLFNVIAEVPEEPMTILREMGFAPIVKSPGGGGGGGGGGGAVTVRTWDWVDVRPPVSIAATTTV